jgi:hypothetical protein
MIALLIAACLSGAISYGVIKGLAWVESENAKNTRANARNTSLNERRRADLEEMRRDSEQIRNGIARATSGLFAEPPTPEIVFKDLTQTGGSVESKRDVAPGFFTVLYRSEIEFHRLLPSLSVVENRYPLLRLGELTMQLPAGCPPFSKEATRLQTEITFAFPAKSKAQ